ncbi:MAG: hypothetical protein ACM3MA_02335 [Acidobacteriota bacterium]|jgi:cell division protein FtsB
MTTPNIKQLISRYRHIATVQNAGLAAAVVIALSWVWGAVSTLQQNYQHQRQVDTNAQQIEIMKLQNKNYTYQQAYYNSSEFLELSARTHLMKAMPGETLVLLPDSSQIVDDVPKQQTTTQPAQRSNLEKWTQFFFGQ